MHYDTIVPTKCQGGDLRPILPKRLLVLAAVAVAAIVLGRLAVRAAMNLLLGGTLFGGNFL